MLMRFDPFRDLDRLTQQAWGGGLDRRPAVMPMDAYRSGDEFLVHFDLPGVDPNSVELTVEKNVLTVNAQRQRHWDDDVELVVSERPTGSWSRQLFLGETLDSDHIQATYENGVLTVRIPVAEKAKPRRVEISSQGKAQAIEAESSAA